MKMSSSVSRVLLRLSAAKLLQRDIVSPSDPYAIVFVKEADKTENGHWVELARTEIIDNSNDPVWNTPIDVVYKHGEAHPLKFVVWDHDEHKHDDYLGEVETTLEDILAGADVSLALELTEHGNIATKGRRGTLSVTGSELLGAPESLCVSFRCAGLDNKDWFSKSDPYLTLCEPLESERQAYASGEENVSSEVGKPSGGSTGRTRLWSSSVLMDNLNPAWPPALLPIALLCGGDMDRPLVIECWDWNNVQSHELIGTTRPLSVNDMLALCHPHAAKGGKDGAQGEEEEEEDTPEERAKYEAMFPTPPSTPEGARTALTAFFNRYAKQTRSDGSAAMDEGGMRVCLEECPALLPQGYTTAQAVAAFNMQADAAQGGTMGYVTFARMVGQLAALQFPQEAGAKDKAEAVYPFMTSVLVPLLQGRKKREAKAKEKKVGDADVSLAAAGLPLFNRLLLSKTGYTNSGTLHIASISILRPASAATGASPAAASSEGEGANKTSAEGDAGGTTASEPAASAGADVQVIIAELQQALKAAEAARQQAEEEIAALKASLQQEAARAAEAEGRAQLAEEARARALSEAESARAEAEAAERARAFTAAEAEAQARSRDEAVEREAAAEEAAARSKVISDSAVYRAEEAERARDAAERAREAAEEALARMQAELDALRAQMQADAAAREQAAALELAAAEQRARAEVEARERAAEEEVARLAAERERLAVRSVLLSNDDAIARARAEAEEKARWLTPKTVVLELSCSPTALAARQAAGSQGGMAVPATRVLRSFATSPHGSFSPSSSSSFSLGSHFGGASGAFAVGSTAAFGSTYHSSSSYVSASSSGGGGGGLESVHAHAQMGHERGHERHGDVSQLNTAPQAEQREVEGGSVWGASTGGRHPGRQAQAGELHSPPTTPEGRRSPTASVVSAAASRVAPAPHNTPSVPAAVPFMPVPPHTQPPLTPFSLPELRALERVNPTVAAQLARLQDECKLDVSGSSAPAVRLRKFLSAARTDPAAFLARVATLPH